MKLKVKWTKETYEDMKKYNVDNLKTEEEIIKLASKDLKKEKRKITLEKINHIFYLSYRKIKNKIIIQTCR